jgi:hypothetical protein
VIWFIIASLLFNFLVKTPGKKADNLLSKLGRLVIQVAFVTRPWNNPQLFWLARRGKLFAPTGLIDLLIAVDQQQRARADRCHVVHRSELTGVYPGFEPKKDWDKPLDDPAR